MNLSWKDYLAMHWPYLAMGLIAIVSFIYAFGFEQGKRNILWASERASYEARKIVPGKQTINGEVTE